VIRGANRRVRQQCVRAGHRVRPGILAERAIGFVPDDPWHAVTVPEPSPGVHPVPAVRNDVRDVGSVIPRHRAAGVLDAYQRLLRTVEWRGTPLDGFSARFGERVAGGVPWTDRNAVRHPAAQTLAPP